MANDLVPDIYNWIMDDVIKKISQTFAELGLDVNVLSELQQVTNLMMLMLMMLINFCDFIQTWEKKIVQRQVAPFVEPATTDLKEAKFNPAVAVQRQATTAANYSIPTGSLPNSQVQSSNGNSLYNSNPRGNSRSPNQFLQQHDGADETTGSIDALDRSRKHKPIGQLDGKEEDELDDDEAEIAAGEGDINSDLDDEDEEEQDSTIKNMVLCQFEKVQRVKTKWKCVLKDGVVHVNGKDYLFSKANCDFEW